MTEQARSCAECGAVAEALDIICSACGSLLYEPERVEVEYIPPESVKSLDLPSQEDKTSEDPESKGRQIGASVAESIFGRNPLAKKIGEIVGGYIGREVKAGTKLVEVGTDGERRFPTAVPRRRRKKKKRTSSSKP